jgi:hypothetical protein
MLWRVVKRRKWSAHLPGIALAATLDQSDGRIPKSSPYILVSSSLSASFRLDRRIPPCPMCKPSKTVDLRFDRRLAIFLVVDLFVLNVS